MRHDETPKVDEMDAHLSTEHYCPPLPESPPRRGTTFLNARPDDYVTTEHRTPAPRRSLLDRFWNFETAITPMHLAGFFAGLGVGLIYW